MFSGENTFKNNSVDIFNPTYGAIKIDLVFKPGFIVGITKNVCKMLGYKA
jgi:hypothetical protein